MDTEDRKINYIDVIECNQEISNIQAIIFQDLYFSFMEIDIDGENIRNKNLNNNNNLNENNILNENNNLNEDNNFYEVNN